MSLHQVVQHVQLPPSAISRLSSNIVQTLLVEKKQDSGQWRCGGDEAILVHVMTCRRFAYDLSNIRKFGMY